MSSIEVIERLCAIIQAQAEIINKQQAALEQFGAAGIFTDDIFNTEEKYEAVTGQTMNQI